MIDLVATVESNQELVPGYRLLAVSFEQDITTQPGQFAMIRPADSLEPLLRRALAIYRQTSPRHLSFLYQVLGRGTEALSRVVRGSRIEALLPLGNSWPVRPEIPDGGGRSAASTDRAIVVAGGIGSVSLLMLSEQLTQARVETKLLFGAGSKAAARGCGLEDFAALGLPVSITTDDGSLGEPGLVTQPLERLLHEKQFTPATIYACGPWAMMRRVAEIAERFRQGCFVSLEAPMGCGFGVCVGCVVAVKRDAPPGYESYRRVCVDGSIFKSEEIDWTIDAMIH